ncbi:MAG TPA: TetR/AcrR family transcriptional regulator [Stellaceae bacterium]|nr:TetR/AcrR family transcriptional regulator [Stellaceae bacterium]
MIEAAAADLFARHGFDGVSQRQIAAAAGIRLGTLTYLYADKVALYDRTVEAAIDYFGEALLAAVNRPAPPLARLEGFITAMTRLHAERTVPGQIIAREMIEGESSRMAVLGRAMFRRLRAAVSPLLIDVSGRALSEDGADRLTGQMINMTYAAVRSTRLYAGAFGAPPPRIEDQAAELRALILFGIVPRPPEAPSSRTDIMP